MKQRKAVMCDIALSAWCKIIRGNSFLCALKIIINKLITTGTDTPNTEKQYYTSVV